MLSPIAPIRTAHPTSPQTLPELHYRCVSISGNRHYVANPHHPAALPHDRCNAFHIVTAIGQAAFMLLGYVSHAAFFLTKTTNSPTDNLRAVQALTHRDFMQAVADALRGMTETTAFLRSEAAVWQLSYSPFDLRAGTAQQVSISSTAAEAVCRYARLITELLLRRLHQAGTESAGSPVSSIPPDMKAVYEALAGSQLLAASAGALLEDPGIEQLPEAVQSKVTPQMRSASAYYCTALSHTHLLWGDRAYGGGHEGQQLAAGLLRALRHREVQRLQVALLDQLAVHAGMGAGLVVDDQGEQQGGQQEGQQACGWEGSSGTWWLAREEQRQGKLVGWERLGGAGSGQMGDEDTVWWLEDFHCYVLHGTLVEWGCVTGQLAGPAGVEARPPPLLVARLAARAAEALCRLYRGQGLEGAYAAAPEWLLAKAQVGGGAIRVRSGRRSKCKFLHCCRYRS